MTIDPTGAYFRRDGLDNHYVCGLGPTENEEVSVDDLNVDPDYFESNILPILASRVPAFGNLKVYLNKKKTK